MPVNPVTNIVARYVQQVTSGSAGQGGLAAMLQEQTETLAETRKEAASGDVVALRKLAQMQQAEQLKASQPPQKSAKSDTSQAPNTPTEEASESATERAGEARGGAVDTAG